MERFRFFWYILVDHLGKEGSGRLVHTHSMEWPPHSGKQQEFPEVDCGEWFNIEKVTQKIQPGQRGLLMELNRIQPGAINLLPIGLTESPLVLSLIQIIII
jgi:hypothetical protein